MTLKLKKQKALDIRDTDDFLTAANRVAMKKDMEHRFSEYKDDPSIGNMYQRKKKSSKTKSNRKSTTKECGCK